MTLYDREAATGALGERCVEACGYDTGCHSPPNGLSRMYDIEERCYFVLRNLEIILENLMVFGKTAVLDKD